MLVYIVLIIIGFALLIKGADFLVEGSSKLAKRFHIPEIIIGLTIISIGTSMPELFVSIIPICLAITIVFAILCNIGQDISRQEGIILTILFGFFIIYTIFMAIKGEKFDKEEGVLEEEVKEEDKSSILRDIIYIVIGIIALKFGGDLTVDNAVEIAHLFNLSEKIISVTILAIRNEFA